jgi:uncharacterized protein (TIGR00369 family)
MSDEAEPRTRTYSWDSPDANAAAAHEGSGLEFLQAMLDGRLPRPPMARTLDFGLAEVREGEAVFVSTPAEFHYNPIGTVHGGFFGALLDTAMGCSVHTTLRPGEGYTTLEYKVNLVRPMTSAVGEVRCEGWVVHRGSRVATAEGRIVDGRGKVYAHGSTTCMIFASWDQRDRGRGEGGQADG